MYLVEDFYLENKERLSLECVACEKGLKRRIQSAEVNRPGLILAGYGTSSIQEKRSIFKRIIVLGKTEIRYLLELSPEVKLERIRRLFKGKIPAVIVAGFKRLPKELIQRCEESGIPLFKTALSAPIVINKIYITLLDALSPSLSCHGTLVEAFGVGMLIQGDSSVGKSEAALGLIDKGHRLIADDVVKLKKNEGGYLVGRGDPLARHHMEIRGIGIINVAYLYGAVCVRGKKVVDIVVKLEPWDDHTYYDRVGLDDKYCEMLGIRLPYYLLPVKPGRDVVLLLETLALNHQLKRMGYHSAKEFNQKLLERINSRKRMKRRDRTET